MTARDRRHSLSVYVRTAGTRLAPGRTSARSGHGQASAQVVVVSFSQGATDVVATHVRRPSGRSTDFTHYPPEKTAFRMRTPAWCRRTGESACQAVAFLQTPAATTCFNKITST